MALSENSSTKSFGGHVKAFSHESSELKCKMNFAVFVPPQAETQKVPVLYYLSGLTCTDQNFTTKAGVQRIASELGILVVAPDTSPRGCNIEGEEDGWDFGTGAGFYVDATTEKWKTNYRMFSYVTKELPALIEANFPVAADRCAITGHSMGGHGALICALKNPGKYRSVSAFAPICNPVNCPWGEKAFSGYLGDNKEVWKEYDATELVKKYSGPPLDILIDQGKSDGFYPHQLLPENFVQACRDASVACTFRLQEGYDHSYYFIATFLEDHVRHHARYLKA